MEVMRLLVDHPSVRFEPQEFVGLLPKLQPRLYSIASSLKAFPEAVHFIVDVVTYTSHGRKRKGVCSTFMAERCSDAPVPIFPTVSKFRLPEESDAPIIMVGPRARLAPFRAFFAGTQATGARGNAGLFWRPRRKAIFITAKISSNHRRRNSEAARHAFSRDQEHKIYVHDRICRPVIVEMAREGAYFYVLRRRETNV